MVSTVTSIDEDLLATIQKAGPRPSFRDLLRLRRWEPTAVVDALDRLMHLGLVWTLLDEGLLFAAVPRCQTPGRMPGMEDQGFPIWRRSRPASYNRAKGARQ